MCQVPKNFDTDLVLTPGLKNSENSKTKESKISQILLDN